MKALIQRMRWTALPLAMSALLGGCKTVVLNPSGDIAVQQADLLVISTALMLLIIVPVIVLTVVFAWKYRQSNAQAEYEPEWDHSTQLELVIWGAPLLIIIVLGLITWTTTHLLDPYRPLDRIDANRPVTSETKPLEVQVVSLDWKWLFIYPEQGIATVNELVTPVDVPVRFKLTSSTVMNSFYIPALAGQIYTMPSMETTLHAVINKAGEYEGFSAQYSGAGFSHMRFKYKGVSPDEFNNWVKKVKSAKGALTKTDYLTLEKPSEKAPVQYFAKVEDKLFHDIVNRCVKAGSVCMDQQMHADNARLKSAASRFNDKIQQEVCTSDDKPAQVSLSRRNAIATPRVQTTAPDRISMSQENVRAN